MKIIENLKQINNNIATIVEESFSELSKVRLNKNDFYYRTLNSKLNLNFVVFGENNLTCIGLKVKDQFLRYRVVNKYKVITLMNAHCSFGQRIIIILNDSKKIDIFKKLYKWIHQDLSEDINCIKTFDDLVQYIDQYGELFEKKIDRNISKESSIGLYGELDLINDLIKNNNHEIDEIIESWSGYSRSTHDFNLGRKN